MGKLKTALFAAKLVPFMADNRLHVVPPCVVTEDEARRGLAIIDQVLADLK
jgi:taurine--2-oxoglutarate transaminase